MDLEPRQALLHAAGRHEAVGAAASRGAPAGAGPGDIAALEQPVLGISVMGEAADRALGARRAVAVVERAVAVLPAPDRIGVVFGQVWRGLERVLAPGVGRVRAEELRGQPGVAVQRFPLRGERDAVALAVEILGAILADRKSVV